MSNVGQEGCLRSLKTIALDTNGRILGLPLMDRLLWCTDARYRPDGPGHPPGRRTSVEDILERAVHSQSLFDNGCQLE